MSQKAYRATGSQGGRTADTPRAAAVAYFAAFPKSRKCDVMEGTSDGAFFTVLLSRLSTAKQWKNITPKSVDSLPNIA